MPWTTSDRVKDVRARSHVVDVAVEMLDGWRRHLTGRNASVLSFFSFLSIFPLLLAVTTIIGFVLEGNESLQDDIIDSALAEIPVLGTQLQLDPTSLHGSVPALVLGVVLALWSGTKAFVGLQGALDDIWEIHVDERPSMPIQRLKALAGIGIFGGSVLGSVVITNVVQAADLPAGTRVVLSVASIVLNVLVIAAMYRFLTTASPSWRDVLPGAAIAGVLLAALQHFGTMIVRRITDNASDTYGQFALVLGLVTWLGFVSIAVLMCAELNAAIERLREPELPPAIEPQPG